LVGILTLVLAVVIVVAVLHIVPIHPGGGKLPGVLSVLPESSDAASRSATSLANNTSGGPWTVQSLVGWDNTDGLSQVPAPTAGPSCPLSEASISNFGVLASNATYWTGYAEGWWVEFSSTSGGLTNLLVWVGDGNAYRIGVLSGSCALLGDPGHAVGTAYTSTGAASAALTVSNYSRFVTAYPAANATYLIQWVPFPWSDGAVPLWTITLTACNGTVPEVASAQLWASNGTVRDSFNGEGPGATCGSSDAVAGPTRLAGAGLPELNLRARPR
jgi:hypothetical protein